MTWDDEDEDRINRLAWDPIIPALIRENLPINFENWAGLAGYSEEDLEDAEIMSGVPWQITELDDGEAVHPWLYWESVVETAHGQPPHGPADARQIFFARVRLWLKQHLPSWLVKRLPS